MNSQETKAVLAARRAYKSAIAAGAEGRIALDVACAAYRVFHPVIGDQHLVQLAQESYSAHPSSCNGALFQRAKYKNRRHTAA